MLAVSIPFEMLSLSCQQISWNIQDGPGRCPPTSLSWDLPLQTARGECNHEYLREGTSRSAACTARLQPGAGSAQRQPQVSSKALQTHVLLRKWLDLASPPGHSPLRPRRPHQPLNPFNYPIPMFDTALAAALALCGPDWFVLS